MGALQIYIDDDDDDEGNGFPLHSVWSESSAACPTPRGRRRGGEKFGPGAFATLERVVFSCKGAERDEWRGPKGPSRCFGCGSFVAERRSSGEARRAESTSPFSWRLISNAKF